MVLSGPLMFWHPSCNFKSILWNDMGGKWKWQGKNGKKTLDIQRGSFFLTQWWEEFTGRTLSRAEVSCPWNMVTSFGSQIKQQHGTELGRSIRKVGASGRKGSSQAEGVWPLIAKQMTSDRCHVSMLTCNPRLSMRCIFLTEVTYKCPLWAPEGFSPVQRRGEWPERRVRMLHRREQKPGRSNV